MRIRAVTTRNDNPYTSVDCEGTSRRDLLKIGAGGLFGLSLLDFVAPRATRAAAGGKTESRAGAADKNFIFIWLQGGPAHMDMWDPNPDAPDGIRTPFKCIESSVPGVRFTELMPRTAAAMDKLCLLRSVASVEGSHNRASRYLQSGYRPVPNVDHPAFASLYVNDRRWRTDVPPYVGLLRPSETGYGGGFLGAEFNPFFVGDPSRKGFSVKDLLPASGIPLDRVTRRREILEGFDRSQRLVDENARSLTPALDLAYRLIFSEKAKQAFDLHREADKLRDRYGRTPLGQSCLLARRLIEGGVKCASIFKTGWDTHSKNFDSLKKSKVPELDPALATLVEDLDDRGMLDDTLVVCLGEFGRTPKINKNAGRDHWPNVNTVVMAGGGLKRGVVIGKSDKNSAEPAERPIVVADFAATLFHSLGVDVDKENHTAEGRPVRVTNHGKPVLEAFG